MIKFRDHLNSRAVTGCGSRAIAAAVAGCSSGAVSGCFAWIIAGCVAWIVARIWIWLQFCDSQFFDSGAVAWSVAGCGCGAVAGHSHRAGAGCSSFVLMLCCVVVAEFFVGQTQIGDANHTTTVGNQKLRHTPDNCPWFDSLRGVCDNVQSQAVVV